MQALAVLFIGKVLEFILVLIVVRQSVASTDPHASLAVGHDNAGYVVGNAVRVVLIVLVDCERVSIVFIDTVISGKPHIPELVLCYGEYGALRQAVVNGNIREVYLSPSL